MTEQYVVHMTEDKYGWIAQLVEHPPSTWNSESSFSHFVLLGFVVVVSRRADVGCKTFPSLTTFYKNMSNKCCFETQKKGNNGSLT